VEFTATDLDVTVACKVEAKVKKGGSTTVPVKKLIWHRPGSWAAMK